MMMRKFNLIRSFILFYLCLSVIGFILLSLPGIANRPLTNLEVLFTTISAVTLTGLQICDFAGIFTMQGQLIVLALIQFGAIIIISFSLYFGWMLAKGSLFIDNEKLLNSETSHINPFKKILRNICIYLLAFELVSSGILYAFWTGDVHFTTTEKLGYAFFHGVSVFCHSGFSNLEGNFSNPNISHSYLLLFAVTGVIVLGSIGYATTFDLISIKRLRERMLDPDKNWTLQTRIALYSTIGLIAGGSIIWYISEIDRSLAGKKLIEAAFTAIFNVAGARSAGFYSVNVSTIAHSLSILYTVLMIIGASASSPGGGIKTSVLSSIFTKKNRIGAIPMRLFLYYVAGVLILSLIFLMAVDPEIPKSSLRFEVLSAFTNTGLSSGITPTLSLYGKYILMLDMVLGRVGIPVVLYWLMQSRKHAKNEVLMF